MRKRRASFWCVREQLEDIDISVDGENWIFSGQLIVHMVFDNNAEACADGRGHPMTYEDDRQWTLDSVNSEDGTLFVPPHIPTAVVRAIEEWAESYQLPDVSDDGLEEQEPPDVDR